MPERPVRTVGIVGTGLIGGSLGMASRASGKQVIGFDRDPSTRSSALRRGAVDHAVSALDALGSVDLVIVATPLRQTVEVASFLFGCLPPDVVVTDVGSVKGPIVESLDEAGQGRFVGGHPMFGSEGSGIESASPSLLLGAPFILTPTQKTDPAAVDAVVSLVVDLKMRPIRMDPHAHDRQVAFQSHLPYLLACALALVAPDPSSAGPAFRDATRVAQSPTALWEQILTFNRREVQSAVDRLCADLTRLATLEGGELLAALEEARSRRRPIA